MFGYMGLYIFVFIWICKYIYTYPQRESMCTYIHIHVPAHIHMLLEVSTCLFICVYRLANIYTYTDNYMCVHGGLGVRKLDLNSGSPSNQLGVLE